MERWKPLRNFPGYSGSTEGRIMNRRTLRILTPSAKEDGSLRVCLRKNNQQHVVRVAKVIAETFLGEHPGMDVRHRDNDHSNVRVSNLYWSTHSEAIRDAYARGSKIPYQSIPVQVVETGEIYQSILECSRELGCDKNQISKQLNGERSDVKGYHFRRVN